jgi:hypothetical protein
MAGSAAPTPCRGPMRFHTIIEPFRIKTVEPIRQTTRAC